jgi:hypothetical protein
MQQTIRIQMEFSPHFRGIMCSVHQKMSVWTIIILAITYQSSALTSPRDSSVSAARAINLRSKQNIQLNFFMYIRSLLDTNWSLIAILDLPHYIYFSFSEPITPHFLAFYKCIHPLPLIFVWSSLNLYQMSMAHGALSKLSFGYIWWQLIKNLRTYVHCY